MNKVGCARSADSCNLAPLAHSNVRSVQQLNEYELQRLASSSDGSKALAGHGFWHDEYRDSAVIFVGGLDPLLTEGDVIAIFSQYGEILDINLPRFSGAPAPGTASQVDNPAAHERAVREAQQKKGKRRGFGFLLYQDQRSTILAVDNLNASVVLGKTMRVDHVKDYKQLSRDEDTGKMKESDEHRTNARPEMVDPSAAKKRSGSADDEPLPEIDLEDPMASYIASQKRRSRNGDRRGDDGSNDDDDAEHGRRRYKTSEVVKEAQREAKKQRKEERARIREQREQRRRDRPDDRIEHSTSARASERRSRSRSRSFDDNRRRYRDRELDPDRRSRHRVDDRDRYRDKHADEEWHRRR